MENKKRSITDVENILVGQVSDSKALTGCTVILCEEGAVCGVDQRGGAPGTRETDLLRPMHMVEKVCRAGGQGIAHRFWFGCCQWSDALS